MKMLLRSLFVLLLAGGAYAADRQGEVCGDGTYHQSGFCPAVLSSPTSASVGSTTASCRATSDVADGTQYCCVTSTSTPLSASGVATCSGGAAVAGANQAVSGSGVQTVPATGLTASTNYYAQSANLSPEQWYSNAVVSSQFTTTSPGGGPLTIVQAFAGEATGGGSDWTQAISAVGSGNSLVMATWVITTAGAPSVVTDSEGGTYTLDYTHNDGGGFTARYYRRTGINDAPTSVTVNYGSAVDAMTSVIEVQGTITPEVTATAYQANGQSITMSATALTNNSMGFAVGSFGIGKIVTIDAAWEGLHQGDPGNNVGMYMLYKAALGPIGPVGFTNTWTGQANTQGYASLVTYAEGG